MISASLFFSSFLAGLLTFLAPCTLPLVPGYLGFISGVSTREFFQKDLSAAKTKIFLNGMWYVLGFSAVFILLGSLFGLGGGLLLPYRLLLGRIGGVVVVFFGLYMVLSQFTAFHSRLGSKAVWLGKEWHLPGVKYITPGHGFSSFLFGATFAFGWTPCIGPILATILLLASQSATVGSGALLLAVFSAGLAIPFLLLAALIGSAAKVVSAIVPLLRIVALVGGFFLILLGILLITDHFDTWIAWFFRAFSFLNYERLLLYM
jgi:cytochrome c-type biogenesis protein